MVGGVDGASYRACYGLLSFFLALIHNVFLIYHVDVFVYSYQLDKSAFWLGEVAFLLWNSLNDPLFGYLADSDIVAQNVKIEREHIIQRRLHSVKYYGPLLSLSFALFWLPILPLGLHFVLGLCLYDSFLTIVDLNLNSLLADISTSNSERTTLSKHRSMGNIAASVSVFISYSVWDQSDLATFKIFCTVLSFISCVGFYGVASYLLRDSNVPISRKSGLGELNLSRLAQALFYMSQLCQMPNFVCFILMSLIQVFHCHFNSSFMPVFMELLLRHHFPPYFCPLVMGLSFLLPHLNNFYFLQLCEKKGTYHVIRSLLIIKFVLALGVLSSDVTLLWLIAVFIASNRIFTEGICRLCDLVIADLIDEDYVQNDRQVSASAFFFGSAAMLTKPGQSFAPIIGTTLLSFVSHNKDNLTTTKEDGVDLVELQSYCLVLTGVPIACSILQLVLWSKFDLRDGKLKSIKSILQREKIHSV